MVKRWLSGLLLCVLPLWVGAAELIAQLDREDILEHESVTLTLTFTGEAQLDLNLAPLERDFEVLGESRSHNTRIVNGEISVRQVLSLQLAPRRSGRLTVPPLSFFGATTEPLSVTVAPGDSVAIADRGHFIEAEVSNVAPWVQQQVIYTVRIFQRTPVVDGRLSEPTAADLNLARLGTDRSYVVTRDGVEWDVLERRYALFPQRSGTLDIDPVRLTARVAVGQNTSSFFGRQTRQIRLRGPRISLDVQAAPSSVAWWLPAAALSVTANWLDVDVATVGEPVTLEWLLTAHGVQASQLPALPFPDVVGAKHYPDATDSGEQSLSTGLVAQRRFTHQLVPTDVGTLNVPDVVIDWFNTTTERDERSTFSVPPLDVIAPLGWVKPETPATAEAPAAAENESGSRLEPPVVEAADARKTALDWLSPWVHRWPLLIGVLAVCVGVWAERRWLRALRVSARRNPRNALKRLRRAMAKRDRAAAQAALALWASRVWPQDPPRSARDIAERVGERTTLGARLLRFERQLYRADAGEWSDPKLVRALARLRLKPERVSAPNAVALPSLGLAWQAQAAGAAEKNTKIHGLD